MEWKKEPLTRQVARGLRAATRKHPPFHGHRFSYGDLKELWSSDDQRFLVLTHSQDKSWQLWWQSSPEGGWMLVSVHPTREQAQQCATGPVSLGSVSPGLYMLAWNPQGRTIRVLCGTQDRLAQLQEIFVRMGYQVGAEEVGE